VEAVHSRWNLSDWKERASPRAGRASCSWPTATSWPIRPTTLFGLPEDALVRIAPDDIRKKGKVPKNGSIFFTIFQTFMSGPPKDGQPSPYFGEYPPDFFDFIVIDECHRGGANDEEQLARHPRLLRAGRAAGPDRHAQAQDNADTYAYFGEPVFIYSLKEGINDGFLTPFGQADRHHAGRLRLHARRHGGGRRDRGRQALRGEGLQQDHRDQGARRSASRSSWT
jgi:type I restriction enzyme R subunit